MENACRFHVSKCRTGIPACHPAFPKDRKLDQPREDVRGYLDNSCPALRYFLKART
jgi:hypothetical protein